MATQYTSLLGLALPVTGELSGTWGDTVNDAITSLLDTAVAGTTTLSTDGDVTLTTTTGASNQARQAILLCSGARTALRTITAPAQSKIYTVINATTGGYSVKVVGAGPTTGVTIVAGESAVIAWNGSDFIKISNTGGGGSFTNVTISGTTTLSGLTASTALALNASKEVVSVTNTGSGNNVLATSPTLVTPALGTPSSATLTNATGLPISTGVSGLGTGIATALAVNVGSAGAPVLFNGALGTPSSGTVTNLTGTASININGTVGATTPTTGAFTDLTFSGSGTVSGGTANGVAYLNGSKVLTTGSALTFDGTRFIATTGGAFQGSSNPASGASVEITYGAIAGAGRILSYDRTGAARTPLVMDGSYLAGYANGTEGMRLTSTGLGIGTSSPTNALSVTGNANITGNTTLGDATTDTVTVNGYMGVGGAAGASTAITVAPTALTGTLQYGVSAQPTGTSAATNSIIAFDAYAQVANSVFTVSNVYGLSIRSGSKGASATATNWHGIQIADQTQGTNNYGITSLVSSGANKWNIYASGTAANYFAGNVGIGATPNAWFTGYRVVDFGTSNVAANGGNTEIGIQSNNYRDAAANFIYKTTAAAARYSISAGQHAWYNAPSGTAGDTITYTQAMTLNASGNLGIGTSSPAQKLHISGSSSTNIYGRWSNGTQELYLGINSSNVILVGSLSNDPLAFFANSAERMRIDTSGNIIRGATSGVVSTGGSVVGIETLGGTTAASSIGQYAFATTNAAPFLEMGFSRNATVGSQTVVNSSDVLGAIRFSGSDGTNFVRGAQIAGVVDGTPGTNDMPGRLIFSTSADGSATPTERMRLDSAGNLGIGTAANASAILDAQSTTKGVRFPNMTTTQKNAIASPAAGLVIFDTTLSKLCVYTGAAWQTITSA